MVWRQSWKFGLDDGRLFARGGASSRPPGIALKLVRAVSIGTAIRVQHEQSEALVGGPFERDAFSHCSWVSAHRAGAKIGGLDRTGLVDLGLGDHPRIPVGNAGS